MSGNQLKTLWSCEVDYHGWEDDIHHHHFFIQSDTRPSERAVVDIYNTELYDSDDYATGWIQPCPKEDRFDTGWEMVDEYGEHDYDVHITITPLKITELTSPPKKPEFKTPESQPPLSSFEKEYLLRAFTPYQAPDSNLDDAKSFFSGEAMVDAKTLLSELKFGQTIDIGTDKDE